MGPVRGSSQREFKAQLRSGRSIANYGPAQSFNPLAHAANTISFSLVTAASIVLNFEHAVAVVARNA